MLMDDKLQTAVSDALKSIRIKTQMSQEDLAHACELDRTYISGIERKTRNPTIKTIGKIIPSLNITEQEFLLTVIDILNNDKNKDKYQR